MNRDIPLGHRLGTIFEGNHDHPPNSYCRVTFYVASVQSLELASSTEPQRLNTGEIEATWTDNRHRRPHQLDRRPSRRLSMGGGAMINTGHTI
jgi:hypothetical protein